MKAVVWHGRRDLRLEDAEEPPQPRHGEALVAVDACGICGTDLHEYVDGPSLIRATEHPLTGEGPPLILGHEFSGRVVALGAGADESRTPRVGERVAVDPCWSCGRCFWCLRGDYHICRVGGSVGLCSNGALAPLVRVPASGLVRLPDTITATDGALVEPLAVGLHAARQGGVGPGDHVLVVGFGAIGAAVLLAVRAAGAASVFVSEPTRQRRDRACAMGAVEAFDPGIVDVRREVFLRTNRVGPDVVFDCTGLPSLLPGIVESARRGGTVVTLGVGHGEAPLSPARLSLFERRVVGSLGYNHDHQRVVDLIAAGVIDAAQLVTAIVPLEHAVDGAFDVLATSPGDHLKILVDVRGSVR